MPSFVVSALAANCSGRKSVIAAPALCAASLVNGPQEDVARQWMSRLDGAKPVAEASTLYIGRSVQRMRRLSDRTGAPLYVVSAGLGLVKADAVVPSYDLSVSSGNPASVQGAISVRFNAADWWAAVRQSKYASPFTELFKHHDGGLVVIAVSNAYVPLLASELAGLSKSRRESLRLFGSADAKYSPDLRRFLMPYDGRLDALVRGSKVDFAQRAAEHFVAGGSAGDSFPTLLEDQRRWVETELGKVVSETRAKREPVDDARIREIARDLAKQGLTYTTALRCLRNQRGIACEQSRFRRLYLEATT